MFEEITVLDALRVILLWISPIVLVLGLVLLFIPSNVYVKLENELQKEIGGIRKRLIIPLEKNIENLHQLILANKKIVGLVCIIVSLLILLLFK
ncbi:MAG: hypothetical protein NC912_04460 [Candidatus Omnitrophica bacterium]|nr:hypothetical protein [Candidatus Omnitrophota bacterium]